MSSGDPSIEESSYLTLKASVDSVPYMESMVLSTHDSSLLGMHRRLMSSITIRTIALDIFTTPIPIPMSVNILVVWTLPGSLYADPIELVQDLKQSCASSSSSIPTTSGIFVHSKSATIDSESIASSQYVRIGLEYISVPLTRIEECSHLDDHIDDLSAELCITYLSYTMNISIPVHLRYHHATTDTDYAKITIPGPIVYSGDVVPFDIYPAINEVHPNIQLVYDIDHLGGPGNSNAHSLARTNDYHRTQQTRPSTSIDFTMPTGPASLAALVTIITVIVYAASCIVICGTLLFNYKPHRSDQQESIDSE
jgi:PIG-X / PBN1